MKELKLKNPDHGVTTLVIGRKDGAALAVLTSMALAVNQDITRVTLYTEGCPKVLSSEAVAFYEGLRRDPVVNSVVRYVKGETPTQELRVASRPVSRLVVQSVACALVRTCCVVMFAPPQTSLRLLPECTFIVGVCPPPPPPSLSVSQDFVPFRGTSFRRHSDHAMLLVPLDLLGTLASRLEWTLEQMYDTVTVPNHWPALCKTYQLALTYCSRKVCVRVRACAVCYPLTLGLALVTFTMWCVCGGGGGIWASQPSHRWLDMKDNKVEEGLATIKSKGEPPSGKAEYLCSVTTTLQCRHPVPAVVDWYLFHGTGDGNDERVVGVLKYKRTYRVCVCVLVLREPPSPLDCGKSGPVLISPPHHLPYLCGRVVLIGNEQEYEQILTPDTSLVEENKPERHSFTGNHVKQWLEQQELCRWNTAVRALTRGLAVSVETVNGEVVKGAPLNVSFPPHSVSESSPAPQTGGV